MSRAERRINTLNGMAKGVVAIKDLVCVECSETIGAGTVYLSSTRSRRDGLGKVHHTTRRFHPLCANARIRRFAAEDLISVIDVVDDAKMSTRARGAA